MQGVVINMEECICNKPHYHCLNENTQDYSGIQVSIHQSGIIRVRAFTPEGRYSDVVKIKYCPICGRKLTED